MKKYLLLILSILTGNMQAHTVSYYGITIEYEDLSAYPQKHLFYDSTMKVGLPISLLNEQGIKPFKVTIKNQSATQIQLDVNLSQYFFLVPQAVLEGLFISTLEDRSSLICSFISGCLLGAIKPYRFKTFKEALFNLGLSIAIISVPAYILSSFIEKIEKAKNSFKKKLDEQLLSNQEIALGQEFNGYFFIRNNIDQFFSLYFQRSDKSIICFNCPYRD